MGATPTLATMKQSTHSVLMTPISVGISLNQMERRALVRAADILVQLDELAEAMDSGWTDDHPQRADLVLGEAAMRELAADGWQHIKDV